MRNTGRKGANDCEVVIVRKGCKATFARNCYNSFIGIARNKNIARNARIKMSHAISEICFHFSVDVFESFVLEMAVKV